MKLKMKNSKYLGSHGHPLRYKHDIWHPMKLSHFECAMPFNNLK